MAPANLNYYSWFYFEDIPHKSAKDLTTEEGINNKTKNKQSNQVKEISFEEMMYGLGV